MEPADILARAHHARQAQIALDSTRAVRRRLQGVDLRDKRDLGGAVGALVPTLLQQRAASARLAQDYFREGRALAGVGARGIPETGADAGDAEDRIRSSLWILARGRMRDERFRDESEEAFERAYEQARERATREMVGASVRHTLNGGREAIRLLSGADDRVQGWVRVTSQDARVCAFCAMLASREDYKGASFKASDVRFKMGGNPMADAKVHDSCRCSLRPVFYGQGTPEHTRAAQRLWYDLSEGDGRDAWLSFRRNYQAMMKQKATTWAAA